MNRRTWWSAASIGTLVVIGAGLALGLDAGQASEPAPSDAALITESTPALSTLTSADTANAARPTTLSPAGVLATAGVVATTLVIATAVTAGGSVPNPVAASDPAATAVGEAAGASSVASAPAASAPAVEATTSPWYEQAGQEALARISYPWHDRLPGWTVVFLPGRAGLLGGTWTYEHRIEIYVRDGQTVDDVAFTLAHEMGHAIDVTLLTDQDRHVWAETRGLDSAVPWWVESGATDFSSGAGDWAEAFAVFQVGGDSHSQVAAQPGAADLAVVARLSRP